VYKEYLKTIFAYLAGILLWVVLISVLQTRCILNIPLLVDGLWVKQIKGELVTNLVGSVAYKTSGLGCENKLIYLVRYYPDGVGGSYQNTTLTSLVDTDSWHEVSSDTISTTYQDKNHKYILYGTSDEIFMGVYDK
jgi:hypothetical protein